MTAPSHSRKSGVLTRYLTNLYLSRFCLLLFCITAFILSLDLVTSAERVLAQSDDNSFSVAKYAALRVPQVISDTIKYAGLFAALLTLASLMRYNQLVPIWGSGISQFGLTLRFMPIAMVIGCLQFLFDDLVVPASNAALLEMGIAEQIDRRDFGPNAAKSAKWIKVRNDIVRIPHGHYSSTSLRDFVIFKRNDDGQLTSTENVSSAHQRADGWTLKGVTRRNIDGKIEIIEQLSGWGTGFKIADLDTLNTHPRDLSFRKLFQLVLIEAHGAWAPNLYQTWLQVKIAVCLTPLLMIFIAIALSQKFQRSGRTEFLFLGGLAFGFGFFIINGIGLAMGEVGLLPPLIAGWAATIGFIAITGAIAFSHEIHTRRMKAH